MNTSGIFVTIVLLCSATSNAFGLDVSDVFDPTFGDNGVVAGVRVWPNEVFSSSDGKLTVVHIKSVRRFLSDGSLDVSFGEDGLKQLPMPEEFEILSPVETYHFDKSGLLYRTLRNARRNAKLLIARYSYDMNIDPSWGTNGYLEIDSTDFVGSQEVVSAADDGIFFNYHQSVIDPRNGTERIFTSHTWRFDGSGQMEFGLLPHWEGISAKPPVVFNDGSFVIPGSFVTAYKRKLYPFLRKFAADGSVKKIFGQESFFWLGEHIEQSSRFRWFLQDESHLIGIGSSWSVGSAFRTPILVRVNAITGELDTEFNPSGPSPGFRNLDYFGNELSVNSESGVVDNCGRLWFLAKSNGLETKGEYVVRVRSDGNLDTDFNSNGALPGAAKLAPSAVFTSYMRLYALNDGKVLVIDRNYMARFLAARCVKQ